MDNNDKKRGPNVNNKKPFFYTLVAAIIFLALFSYMSNRIKEGSNKEITYDQFIKMVDKGEEIKANNDHIPSHLTYSPAINHCEPKKKPNKCGATMINSTTGTKLTLISS